MALDSNYFNQKEETMSNLLTKWGSASFLAICLLNIFPDNASANVGDAIGGDGLGVNGDSSTYTGDYFAPIPPIRTDSNSAIPTNWRCLRRNICADCDLRLETLGTMLSTNLSGTLTQKVIQDAAPRFCCDPELAARAKAHQEIALLGQKPSNTAESTAAFRVASGNSAAALLDGVKPASLTTQLPAINTSALVAQAFVPASRPSSNRILPVEAAPLSPNTSQLQQELEKALNLQSDPSDEGKTQAQKLKTLEDLMTSLQGLIWEESLPNKNWQKHIDIDQLAGAIKTYNELLSLLSVEELNAWRNNRNGQDVTTVLKKLREGVVVQ